jgi:rhodanese-related sulfurtransferase
MRLQIRSHNLITNGSKPVCRSGNRVRQAAEKLKAAVVDSVVVLDGGLQARERAGLTARRGSK